MQAHSQANTQVSKETGTETETTAEPITGKDTKYIKKAITRCMEKMGGKPKMIYHDAETTFTGDFLQDRKAHV